MRKQERPQACALYRAALYQAAQHRVAPYPDSRFSNVHVRKERRELARRVRRYVQASGVRCILHVQPQLARVRLVLVRGFHRPDQFV